MIKTVALARTFSSSDGPIKAVDEVSVTLPDKGMVFVIGKSGSGKSTLLNLLAGYDSPTSGSIFVNGKDIAKFSQQELSDYQFRDLGFVFQNYSLIENINVYKNIALGSKMPYKKQKAEIDKVLQDVGLKDYGKRLVSKLSGGEKQRVALARAIIKNPKIILCDEPCGNLDSVSSRMILTILKKQSKNALVVVVSHNLNDAYSHADRVLTLEKGRLIEDKVFDENQTRQDDIKYITDFNALKEEEITEINSGLNSGEIKAIFRRKDFFVDNQESEDVIGENAEKEEPCKGHFVATILGIINRNKIKVAVFSILIGLALALFSICYSVESFSGDRFFETAFNSYDYVAASYNKGMDVGDENSQYPTTYYDKITDEDRELIRNSGYSGNAYELYNVPLLTAPTSKDISHRVTIRLLLTSLVFQNFYAYETGGVLVATEDFIKQNLDIDELSITYAEQQEPSGILITDYIADAFCYRTPSLYPNREAVLGQYDDEALYFHVYINGIIDTDYEERLSSIRDKLVSDPSNYLVLLDEENIELYEYLKNSLNIAYTTNENFLEDFRAYNHIVPKNSVKFSFADSASLEIQGVGISYSSALKDNEAMVHLQPLKSIYPNMEISEIEERINGGEGKSAAELVEWDADVTRDLDIDWTSFEFDHIHVFDGTSTDEYYGPEVVGEMGRRIYFSPNVYNEAFDDTFYSYAFYMDDTDGAISLKSLLAQNTLYPNNEIYAAAMDLTDAIDTFGSIFLLLSEASAAIAIITSAYYGVNLVSANKYNIGVFKALGYRGRELTGYYLITLLIFFALVTVFYLIFYTLFLSLVNDFLIDSIAYYVTEKASYFTKFGIFSYSNAMVLSVLASFMGMLGIITLIYLLVLRRFRAIKILQDKD